MNKPPDGFSQALTPHGIVAVMGGNVIASDSCRVPGPGHSTKDRSLSITIDPTMSAGFKCHSFAPGDDDLTCKDYICQRMGIEWRKSKNDFNKSKFTAEYIYRQADGTPYLKVLRTTDKSFPQMHWNGKDWDWGAPKGPKIPYRLPALLGAEHDDVFITEGEKDADNLSMLGFITSTNSEGADDGKKGSWTPELNQYFKDKNVYILPDNDAPGAAHARKVATALTGVAREVHIIELPSLPPKGDVSDWIAKGGTAERLVDLAREATIYDGGADEVARNAGVDADDDSFAVPSPGMAVDLWSKFGPPSLTPGMLSKAVEAYAIAQGRAMGADIAGIAVAALAVCTAAIPDKIQIQVKEHNSGWLEQPRLWFALVGPPSTMKTPIISSAVSPLMKIDAQMAYENSIARAAYDKLPVAERKQTDPPKQTQLMLQDTTIEAAQEIFKDSPEGLLVYQDELSGFFGGLEKYSGARGASKDRAFWLQAFNGGIHTVHRIGRGAVYIPNLSACILGGIQPEAIRKVVEDCADDGLLQRLCPIILQQAVLGQDEPLSDEVFQYAKLIRDLHGLYDSETITLKFDKGAQLIQRRLEGKHLELLACETINRKLSAHIGKYNGIFARLCIVFHCIDHAGSVPPPIIVEQTAARVEAFLHSFLLPHALAFYAGTLGLSDDHDRLSAVAGYILAHGLERITNRDVQRGDRTMRGLKQSETEAIFEQLDALGWISREPGVRFGPGRPTSVWIVNPSVHTEFADRAKAEAERRDRDKALLAKVFGKK